MITKLSHASIYVLDQESAKDFYVNKLGFNLVMNIPLDHGATWLTVSPKGQPDVQLTLMPINQGSMLSEEASANLAELVKNGTFGFGVFQCTDIYATYQELKDKGVEFTKAPTKMFWGMEAMFKDDSGNWFSLGQRDA